MDNYPHNFDGVQKKYSSYSDYNDDQEPSGKMILKGFLAALVMLGILVYAVHYGIHKKKINTVDVRSK